MAAMLTSILGTVTGFSTKPINTHVDDTRIPAKHMLPEKFTPYILNYANTPGTQTKDLHDKVKTAFAKDIASFFWGLFKAEKNPSYQLKEDKSHVRVYDKLPGWLIKGERSDLNVGKDTHIHRIMKAQKIKKAIAKHGLESEVLVPKKFLYYSNSKWYVVAEKIDLLKNSNWVWEPGKIDTRLTPQKAAAVATIALECTITDLHGGNVVISRSNKVAFIDTEPLERKAVKSIKDNILYKLWLVDLPLVKFGIGLHGTQILKKCAPSEAARVAVRKVEHVFLQKHAINSTLKVAGYLATTYAVYQIPVPILPTVVSGALILKAVNDVCSIVGFWMQAKSC